MVEIRKKVHPLGHLRHRHGSGWAAKASSIWPDAYIHRFPTIDGDVDTPMKGKVHIDALSKQSLLDYIEANEIDAPQLIRMSVNGRELDLCHSSYRIIEKADRLICGYQKTERLGNTLKSLGFVCCDPLISRDQDESPDGYCRETKASKNERKEVKDRTELLLTGTDLAFMKALLRK